MATAVPTGKDKPNALPVSQRALQANAQAIGFVRTALAIIAGIVAGVLGLTNLWGFVAYGAMYAVGSVAMLMRMQFDLERYFVGTAGSFVMGGIMGQLVTFLLFWTLAYALVHLY